MRNIMERIEEFPVKIPAMNVALEGDLAAPGTAQGLVLFVHGSGSSRLSPRNRYVAEVLHSAGLATLLFDLLTKEEEAEDILRGHLRFNIPFLAGRLMAAAHWTGEDSRTNHLTKGYFGASTGAAAALAAAAEIPEAVSAVVSRGGRPDLAASALSMVKGATLLIVGGEDFPVLALNREAFKILQVEKELKVIPGATHLFEEPGALEKVAELAASWFLEPLNPKVA
ncbi:MAG: dienelactone hydrolase family protein [Candidatus Tectomicrobia bacterium]|uniref:Dienelactone hydrolase family protein n=1 Tax=Tectimicrobiota bacterium TaxID=2528274 RepID=A0A933GQ16_UNCTE|nr:dienelactone hydrolase family protein [Candidatus Tectomicrobia bacterium]